MKLSKKTILRILVISLALVLSIGTFSYAMVVKAPDVDTEIKAETPTEGTFSNPIKNDVYKMDYDLKFASSVNGNVFLMGNTVSLGNTTDNTYSYDTTISGNVYICANEVVIGSGVHLTDGTLFICARNVEIKYGNIRDLYIAAQNIKISSNVLVLRNANICAQNVTLAGYYSRDLNITGNNITPDFSTGFEVKGNFNYDSASEVQNVKEYVAGNVNYTKLDSNGEFNFGATIISYITSLLTVLIVGALIALILINGTPKYTERLEEILEFKPVSSFLYGLFGIILVPIAIFVLFFTIVGIPIALLSLLFFIFILGISEVVLSVACAKYMLINRMKDSNKNIFWTSIAILGCIWLLTQIPYLGNVVSSITHIYGFGIILYSFFHKNIDKKSPYVEEVKEEKEVKAEKKTAKKESKKTK